MSLFAVIRQAGPAWADGGISAQLGERDHAAFMNALADDGFLLLAGPVAGTEEGRLRVLLIMEAQDEAAIRRRLAEDPWAISERLQISSVEPWIVFVGAERLVLGSATSVAPAPV
jgi:uncharacterized protein YciI